MNNATTKPKRSFRYLLTITTALGVAAPLLPAQAQDDTGTTTPPARVGEIAAVNGTVNFNGAGSNGQWVAATANYPVTNGDSVFTQPGGQATLAVDASRITLAGNTELQVTQLDDTTFTATASQGEAFLAIDDLQPGQSYVVTTPRGTVTINQNGNYDIAAGDESDPTVVTVLAGAATVTDPGATLQVQAGQDAVLSGTDQTTAQLGDAQRDDFMNAMLAEQAPPAPSYAPPVVQQMTGVSELGNYGSWDQDPTYGAVWYPRVSAGWAPYHEGHWAYVAPWGYTWVDSDPWGFAPFHYGRWVDVGDRWGWAPAPAWQPGYAVEAPVYAPALVSFFGIGVGAGVSLSVGFGGGIGWVPLGPNEPYYPPYRVGQDYFRRINVVNVRNVNNYNYSVHNTTIINNYNNYANRRAAMYEPAADLSSGRPVGHYGHPVQAADFAKARPIAYDTAPGAHGAALPPPNFQHRAVPPPHQSEFAQRRELPPAVVSHQPAPAVRPGMAYAGPHPGTPGEMHPAAMAGPAHPGFATMPGYHAPPPPPGVAGQGAHMGQPMMSHPEAAGGQMMRPETQPFIKPPEPPHTNLPQVYHPTEMAPADHPEAAPHNNLPQVYHPTEMAPADHPPPPAYHPEQPAYHPPQQQFQPQEMQRPAPPPPHFAPPQQFHPQEMQRPAPPPPHFEPPPQQHEEQKKPGQP